MNDKQNKQESEAWKAEQIRQERKKRLAQLKDKDGGKKPIREESKKPRVIALLIVLALVIGLGIWFSSTMGLRHRYTKAFTVTYNEDNTVESVETDETSDVKGEVIGDISVSEANIYLGLLGQQYLQGGAFSQMGQDQLSQPSQFSAENTLREDFLISVEGQAKTAEYYHWKAKEEGLTLDEADHEQIDNIFGQYEDIASQSQVTLNHYLSTMFGPGVNEKVFRDFMEKNQLGNKYFQSVNDTFKYDQATVAEKYEENPDDYNFVDYYSYLFTSQVEGEEGTENETADSVENKAEEKANDFMDSVSDPESFKAELAKIEIKDTQNDDASAMELDSSLTEGARKMTLSKELSDWLFADERQENDATIIEEMGGYRVVMFVEKYKPTSAGSYDSRHILFSIEESDPEKSDAKMKEQAEKILAEYQAGEKTEEAFAELAKEYSEDPGSAPNGGLIKGIQPGQLVPEYEEFCLDSDRKAGDVEIIKSSYGYHIVYFVDSTEQWYVNIEQELRHKDQQDFMNKVNATTEIQQEKGIKYFGRP